MNSYLKPCPFCGKKPWAGPDPMYAAMYQIACRHCHAEPLIREATPELTRKEWNRRAPVRVKLPEAFIEPPPTEYANGWNRMRERAVHALKAQGVEVADA